MTYTPKDVVGNELHVGDVVGVKFDGLLIGKVLRVQQGGIAIPNKPGMETASVIILTFEMNIPYGAGIIPNVMKGVNPDSERIVGEVAKKSGGPTLV